MTRYSALSAEGTVSAATARLGAVEGRRWDEIVGSSMSAKLTVGRDDDGDEEEERLTQ